MSASDRSAVLRPVTTLLVLTALLALVAALLVGRAQASMGSTGAAPTVGVHATKLGKVLVNNKGLTLYMFRKDKHHQSACYGKCASFWPPLVVAGKATGTSGVKGSLLGISMRKDGKHQVTYAGFPLYTFALDKKPGDVKGEGSKAFGAGWYVLAPSGKVIDNT